MCGFRVGYTLKHCNSGKLEIADLQSLLNLLCEISKKPCQIARPLPKQICSLKEGFALKNFNLIKIKWLTYDHF